MSTRRTPSTPAFILGILCAVSIPHPAEAESKEEELLKEIRALQEQLGYMTGDIMEIKEKTESVEKGARVINGKVNRIQDEIAVIKKRTEDLKQAQEAQRRTAPPEKKPRKEKKRRKEDIPAPTPGAREQFAVPDVGAWGFGYDEGLAVKYLPLKRVAAYAGLGYWLRAADSVYHQPLNYGSAKLGCEISVVTAGRVRICGFVEFVETLQQYEIAPLGTARYYTRYTVLSSRAGVGTGVEFFPAKNLSITYKLGVRIIYHGTHYGPNRAKTDVTPLDNDYYEIRIMGGSGSILEMLPGSFSLFFYF